MKSYSLYMSSCTKEVWILTFLEEILMLNHYLGIYDLKLLLELLENYNAKLSNLGLATLGPSSEKASVPTVIAGTIGYIAPECITAGDLYLKSDVYGFGVVLLKLLMGLRVIDPKHPCRQQNLFDWLKSILFQKMKLKTIMDMQMEGQYSFEAALQAAQLSLRCLELDPRSRPSMKEVMEVLREIEALASHLHE
ncbi:hypothetical protein LWI28_019216 [Acer negundo]|uniref:Protein kinase domain-containing protein n=1 Tax=Acer negundo TaxID=4023 RepID=A0AAD5INR0_ACENE|nr:hypothetical protein LWI28_019216 [Acer negundo]